MRSEMCFSLEQIAIKKANTHWILVTLTQVQTIFTPSAGQQSTIMSWILIGTFFFVTEITKPEFTLIYITNNMQNARIKPIGRYSNITT